MPKGTQGFQKGNNFGSNKTSFKKGYKPWNFGQGEAKIVGDSGYVSVHSWLKRHYGRADLCENQDCDGMSKTFQWALKKGKKYELKRKNFIKLCRKCHCRYDEWNKKLWKTRTKNDTRGWKKNEISN